jgi:hypothetical protein
LVDLAHVADSCRLIVRCPNYSKSKSGLCEISCRKKAGLGFFGVFGRDFVSSRLGFGLGSSFLGGFGFGSDLFNDRSFFDCRSVSSLGFVNLSGWFFNSFWLGFLYGLWRPGAAALVGMADNTFALGWQVDPVGQLNTFALQQKGCAVGRLGTVLKIKSRLDLVESDSLGVRIIATQLGNDFATGRGTARVLDHHTEHGVAFATGSLHANS